MDIEKQIEKSRLNGTLDFFSANNLRSKQIYPKLPTGFSRLDQLLGGGIAPGVMVLGAISNLGKSTWVLQVAQHVAAGGTPVVYASLEMGKLQIVAKAISRQIFIDTGLDRGKGIQMGQLLNPNYTAGLDAQRWGQIERAREQVAREIENLYIIGNQEVAQSAKSICEFTEQFMEKTGQKPLVIVDYLQILAGERKRGSGDSRQTVDESIQRLKGLSNERNVPVILISSLNRSSYAKPVRFEAFKESGSIEYSADVVLGMQLSAVNRAGWEKEEWFDLEKEKSKSPRDIEIVILKQRYGRSGTDMKVAFDYYMEYDYFVEKGKTRGPGKKKGEEKPADAAVTEEGMAKGMEGKMEEAVKGENDGGTGKETEGTNHGSQGFENSFGHLPVKEHSR